MKTNVKFQELSNELSTLIITLGAEAHIQAVCNSLFDSQTVDDTILGLRIINKTYNKRNAFFQIALLMAKYDIGIDEISPS